MWHFFLLLQVTANVSVTSADHPGPGPTVNWGPPLQVTWPHLVTFWLLWLKGFCWHLREEARGAVSLLRGQHRPRQPSSPREKPAGTGKQVLARHTFSSPCSPQFFVALTAVCEIWLADFGEEKNNVTVLGVSPRRQGSLLSCSPRYAQRLA